MTNTRTEVSRLGYNIKIRREQIGLDQNELAERAGMSSPAVCMIEKGKRTPGIHTLGRIAKALGCEPRELMQGAGYPRGRDAS